MQDLRFLSRMGTQSNNGPPILEDLFTLGYCPFHLFSNLFNKCLVEWHAGSYEIPVPTNRVTIYRNTDGFHIVDTSDLCPLGIDESPVTIPINRVTTRLDANGFHIVETSTPFSLEEIRDATPVEVARDSTHNPIDIGDPPSSEQRIATCYQQIIPYADATLRSDQMVEAQILLTPELNDAIRSDTPNAENTRAQFH